MTITPLPTAGDTSWRDDWATDVHAAAEAVLDGRLADGLVVENSDTRVTADQPAATASIRTLGTGATQAAAGNHAHTAVPAASETDAGVVELATDAETQTGTDTARAVTPANLSARTATETRAGVVELATTAEATTGTDTERAVTPAGLAAVADTKAAATITANTQIGTTYTLVASDAGKAVEMNNAAANVLTVPASVFTAGQVVEVFQYGAGQTTVTAGAGLTLRAPDGAKLAKQYASASLRFRTATEAVLAGNVTT